MGARQLRNWENTPFHNQNRLNQLPDDAGKMADSISSFKRAEFRYTWSEHPGDDTTAAAIQRPWWSDWQLPLLISVFALTAGLVLSLLILVWLKNQMLGPGAGSNEKEGGGAVVGGDASDQGAGSVSQQSEGAQWIYHPVIKPMTMEQCHETMLPAVAVPLQTQGCGNLPEVLTGGSGSERRVRIRAKGLLERRGSSASLTIDLLHPSQENLSVTPTRECTAEEYLLSVGNVLSRGQLRYCLRDVRALHKEFWDLPLNHPDRLQVPGSGTKNRYRTIIPNEVSRVCLPFESSTDPLAGYINANYIKGYDGEDKAFIATQGPLSHTVVDFWSMVWSERAPVIVMITKLWEKSRPKCEPYLPTELAAAATYGAISVTVISVVAKEGYNVRNLELQSDGEYHHVVHFWFDSWPDHKTPANAHSLLSLAKDVEMARFPPPPPQPPSLKDTASPVMTFGRLELQEDILENDKSNLISLETRPEEYEPEVVNVSILKSGLISSFETVSERQSLGSAMKSLSVDSPHPAEDVFKFGSRDLGHSRLSLDRSKSEESPPGWIPNDPSGDMFVFDDSSEQTKSEKTKTESVFWGLDSQETTQMSWAQSPNLSSFDKSTSKLSVDSPNWGSDASPHSCEKSPNRTQSSFDSANLTQSSEKSPNRTQNSFDSPGLTTGSSSCGSKHRWTQSSEESSVWEGVEGGWGEGWVEGLRSRGQPAGPVIVHCSAGIGRTGCFIAICIGVNQLLEENNVDVLGIVCRMRYDRGGMVQTAEQYEFIHRALVLFERSLPDQSGE